MDAIGILMKELQTQADGVIDRMRKGGEAVKIDVAAYLKEIQNDVGVALDTAIQFPSEQTHRNTLTAAANAVWNRTLMNVETFTVAQKYELRAGMFAAVRVIYHMATGVVLV